MKPVLIVEDDEALAITLQDVLEQKGYQVEYLTEGREALAELQRRPRDVVITDLVLKTIDGFEILAAARAHNPPCQVIMTTGYGSRDVAVRALKEGAAFYLEKPIDFDELVTKVEKAVAVRKAELEARELRRQIDKAYGFEGILGKSRGMQKIFDTLWQIAPTDAAVLIRGESGTGKELVARALHNQSERARGPFVALNCGGMNEGIIESELFGHLKGAFTGAQTSREGKLQAADQGTLFLDEVGDMPLATQVKFLRFLEEGEVTPLGCNQARSVDVRLLSATNADLEKKVEEGSFRSDLYFRIKVVELHLPPLRDRREDIRLLAEHYLDHFAQEHRRPITGIEPEALRALMACSWPGNVRELRNCLETMVVTSRGPRLTKEDLPPGINPAPEPTGDPFAPLAGMTLKEVEREMIRVTLGRHEGNREKAARTLGLGERTLYRKIKEYGL